MEEKVKENKQNPKIEKKKVYIPPTLTIYGKLSNLTGGGTNASPEVNKQGQVNPTRRP